MNHIRKILIVILFFAVTILTQGQIRIHRTLSVEDGLTQSSVMAIVQDEAGYVWFGTTGGLSRWDGIDFKNYHIYNGLMDENVTALCSVNEKLFIGTSKGLSVLTNEKFNNYPVKSENYNLGITFLQKGTGDSVLIGTQMGLFVYSNKKIERIDFNVKEFNNTHITSILLADNGSIFIGTQNRGLYIYDKNNLQNYNVQNGLPWNYISYLYEDLKGKIFIGSDKGVCTYSSEHSKFIRNNLIKDDISSILQGDDGKYYFTTLGNGVIVDDGESVTRITTKNGLPNNYLLNLYKGIDGTIYFGTHGNGVSLYRSDQFLTYNPDFGLNGNLVMSIADAGDNKMYFGLLKNGMDLLKDNKIIKTQFSVPESSLTVLAIKKLPDGRLLVGTELGLFIQEGETYFKYIPDNKKLARSQVFGIVVKNEKEIYFGTSSGLYYIKDIKNPQFEVVEHFDRMPVSSLYLCNDNSILIGSRRQGLYVMKNDSVKNINIDDGLVDNTIYSLFESSDGRIFIGTRNGLNILYKNKIDTINVSKGLSDNTIYAVEEDNNGKIYISTNKGVNILNSPDNKTVVRTLLKRDGLASDECNMGALMKDRSGKIWIGTVKGVTSYDPEKDSRKELPPIIHITNVRLFEKEIPVNRFSKDVSFSYDKNYFKFDFIGINISSPQNVAYEYRMKNVDDDWVKTMNRTVQYTNLNDGKHIFEVKAMNEWGYWSAPKSISFTILSPFWERWWFISLMVVLIGTLVLVLLRYRINQLLAVERLRTKIAADLHDNIGASLTEISILGEVVKTKLKTNDDEIVRNLKTITDTSRGMVDKMSDIVWLVNPQRDSLYDLIVRLKDSYTEILSHKGISFKSENLKSLEKISLTMDKRQNIFLIFKEGLHNSLKHSKADEISLNASVNGKELEMVLIDNGIGFEVNDAIIGEGLKNMINRAEAICGKLSIQSTPGKGTQIKFNGTVH